MKRIRLIAIAAVWFGSSVAASAQSATTTLGSPSRPTTGGSNGLRPPITTGPSFGASSGTEILRHRDFTGKPCLEVAGFARSHTVNPNLYDHVITVRNGCPQKVALEVCYYRSRDCIPLEVSGDARKEAILGTLPSQKDFRFEFREKF